ncbi:hypothetical protein RJ639_013504 [Escallonia herrerae]|uniref:6S proteasome subunit Rpn6 C-terminal helix domain-containing protein n=1 Tax=Escallonia herrerae TaxID=1293975 RepID=A0AA88VHR6_9ASTE|nr:hypothetical protein RJ639_013504 [Escallonia herrerae]
MILNNRDSGSGIACLIIFDDPKQDDVYPATLETIQNMGKVVGQFIQQVGQGSRQRLTDRDGASRNVLPGLGFATDCLCLVTMDGGGYAVGRGLCPDGMVLSCRCAVATLSKSVMTQNWRKGGFPTA